jgi:hypothetical protein
MRSLSKSDAAAWCLAQSVTLDAHRRPERPPHTDEFAIPVDTGRRVVLVAADLAGERGATSMLVWFTEWGVWPSTERAHIFDRFRLSYGEARPLLEVPAFLFSSEEFEDAVSFLTLGVLFLWDVFVIAIPGGTVVHYSHDEVGWRRS